jgi:hypothetical protein
MSASSSVPHPRTPCCCGSDLTCSHAIRVRRVTRSYRAASSAVAAPGVLGPVRSDAPRPTFLRLVIVRPRMRRLDCGRPELVNVRPFNLVPRRRANAPGPAPGGYVLMQRKSQGSAEPLSTHSSIQILANEHSLPDVRAYWSVGSDAGELSGVLFLTVEAEHRTGDFDHTASFTISGTRRLLIGCCLSCVPPTRRRSNRCWASSHRRPHRARGPWPREQDRGGTTPGSVGPTSSSDRPQVKPRRRCSGAESTLGYLTITSRSTIRAPSRRGG